LSPKLGSATEVTDMSAEHRASTVTQQKFKDAGLDPATASKHALAGDNVTGGGNKRRVGNHPVLYSKKDVMQANYMAFCAAFPHKVPDPAKAKGVIPNYLQLHEFGLQFVNKRRGKNNARISILQTKRKYSAVAASMTTE
jgi:hypothetical protein